MKIFGDLHIRAEKYLIVIKNMFGMEFKKTDQLSYSRQIGTLDAEWNVSFQLQKSFISRLFKLKISYTFFIDSQSVTWEEPLFWDYRKNEWKAKKRTNTDLDFLNENKEMKRVIKQVDYESIKIEQVNGALKVTMIPIPGSFVFMLLPPMQYFIKLTEAEIKAMKKLGFLVQEVSQRHVNNQTKTDTVTI